MRRKYLRFRPEMRDMLRDLMILSDNTGYYMLGYGESAQAPSFQCLPSTRERDGDGVRTDAVRTDEGA